MGVLPASPTRMARRSSSRGASWSATFTWLQASVASSAAAITCTAGVRGARGSRRRRTTLGASARPSTRALTRMRLPEHSAHLASPRDQLWVPLRLRVSKSPSLRLRLPASLNLRLRPLACAPKGVRPCIAVTPQAGSFWRSPCLIIRRSGLAVALCPTAPYLRPRVFESQSLRVRPLACAPRGARPCIAVTPQAGSFWTSPCLIIRRSGLAVALCPTAPYLRPRVFESQSLRVRPRACAPRGARPCIAVTPHTIRRTGLAVALCPTAPYIRLRPRMASPSLRPLLLFGRTTTRT